MKLLSFHQAKYAILLVLVEDRAKRVLSKACWDLRVAKGAAAMS